MPLPSQPATFRAAIGVLVLALGFLPNAGRADATRHSANKSPRSTSPAVPSPPPADPSDFSHYTDILATWPPEVAAAAMTLSGRPHELWSWHYVNVTEKRTEEFRWDPTLPPSERSILVSRDGSPASDAEKAAHLDKRNKDVSKRAKTPSSERIARARAWLATLEFELLEDTALTSRWKVTSRTSEFDGLPTADRIRNRVLAGLDSRILVSKSPPGFIEIASKNQGPIQAYFSVNFTEVDILLRTERHPGTDTFLPALISGKIRGRYLLIGKIDETWHTTFGNFQPVPPAASPPHLPSARSTPAPDRPAKNVRRHHE